MQNAGCGVLLIMGCGQGPLFGSIFVLKDASPDCGGCPLSGVERRSLLGGCLYIKCMLKSIGAFVFGRSREVGRFWEGLHCMYRQSKADWTVILDLVTVVPLCFHFYLSGKC